MYNDDHGNHISNAQALNNAKTEKTGVVVDGHLAVWDGIGGNLRDGGVLVAPEVPPWDTGDYADDSVTYAKIQNVSATNRILGRITALAGDIEELTGTQATTLLDTFTSALKGLAPASGGGSTNFLRADGTWAAPVSGDYRLLTSGTVSAAATLDIVLTAYTAYKSLELVLQGFTPATSDAELYLRFSTNGGSSYDAAGYKYTACLVGTDSGVATAPYQSVNTAVNQIHISPGPVGQRLHNTAANSGYNGSIQLFNRTVATSRTYCTYSGSWQISSGSTHMVWASGSGHRNAAQDTDAIRLLMSSGNIASGNWALYGRA